MNEQLLMEIAAVVAMIKWPGAIAATAVYVVSLLLGSKTAKTDAKEIKDMFK
jgi:hypothetical protein